MKTNFKNGTLGFAIIVLFFSFSLADSEKAPQISVVEKTHHFGFIPIGFDFIHTYLIYNAGAADLKVSKMIPNCDCTIATINDTSIAPGDTAEIKIVFNTEQYYGPTTRHVAVYSNDPKDSVILLEYSSHIGFSPKIFRIQPVSLFFLPGHKSKEVNLVNLHQNNVEFSITIEDPDIFTTDLTGGEIDGNKSLVLEVMPEENLSKGTHQSNFSVIVKTSEGDAKITVPVKIARF
jgi:hypothetical protein